MADNVAITAGSGTNVATEDVSGVHHQKVKIEYGGDGVATLVDTGTPLPVTDAAGLAAVDTLEALLGSAAPTASAAATTSGQLVAGAGKLVSFSARETAGAAAVFRLRDGSGGTILATVGLAANESVRDTFMGGITYSTSLYLERVSGTTEVTVATR